MKKVVKKSVKKYGPGGPTGDPKRDNMPVPSKQVRSGEGARRKEFLNSYGDASFGFKTTKTEADRRLENMSNLKNSMQKQKKGGAVKRKTK